LKQRMGSSLRLVVTVALAALAVLSAWYIFSTPGLKPVVIWVYGPPRIYAESRIQDVGTVETDSKVPAMFVLYNKGGKTLRISDIQTSCGCTVAKISKQNIAPGDFTKVHVEMDTSIKLGKVRKEITVSSNDPDRPKLTLFLIGNVLPKKMKGHAQISLKAQDPLVLFKGDCASCHVKPGIGKTGKALFLADCAMCHGVNAQGHGSAGPSLLNLDYDHENTLKSIRRVIAEGSPRSPQMPPFSKAKGGPLSEDQIDSLVNFLKFQAIQNKLGLLNKDEVETVDEAAFEEALKQPH
jgi:mono/diheme cytochrome c family protein